MAVDPSQSRIPRLDGVTTRIPVPNTLRVLKSPTSIKSSRLQTNRFKNPQLITKSPTAGEKFNEFTLREQKERFFKKLKKVDDKKEKCCMEIDETITVENMATTDTIQSATIILHDDDEKSLKDIIINEKDNQTFGILETTNPLFITHDITNKDINATNNVLSSTLTCDRILNLTQTIKQPNNDDKFNLTNDFKLIKKGTFIKDDNDTIVINDHLLKQDDYKKTKVLNSTMNNERILDLTHIMSPHLSFCDLTQDISPKNNQTHLLYLTHQIGDHDHKNVSVDDELLDETLINCSDLKDDDLMMDIDDQTKPIDMDLSFDMLENDEFERKNQSQNNGANLENINKLNMNKPRFSFGLDLTDCTLDCSIELCDDSITSSIIPQSSKSPCTNLTKQNSFEIDESLGILTPDQMKEFLDSTTTTTNLDLPLNHNIHSTGPDNKLSVHQYRIDQTPSPEELPLDPVGVKTDMSDMMMTHDCIPSASVLYQELSQTDSDSKTDQMSKSGASKVSNSFITSVTSITSLDTGYQGDGEMSRPASRGADHSPSNMPRILANQKIQNNNNTINWNMNAHPPIARRQDPMTDSDFFTESDADDIFHRGDRRAQVIDGQLYGPTLQAANVYINQQVNADDSCMESSGIFTDVDNRGDDDLIHRPGSENDNDLSPDASTDTIRSNNSECSQKKFSDPNSMITPTPQSQQFTPTDMSPNENKSINIDENLINDDVVVASTIVSIKTNTNETTPVDSKTFSCSLTGNVKKPNTIRKQNKNEANANLKKHEMSKRVSTKTSTKTTSTTLSSSSSSVRSSSRKNSSDENQENKRPNTSIKTNTTQIQRNLNNKKSLPNKWNAVMNKIAENKTTKIKLNLSDIKSKVSTGVILINKSINSSSSSSPPHQQRSPKLIKTPSPINDNQTIINTSVSIVNSGTTETSITTTTTGITTTATSATTTAKRPILCSTKRGRTFSKDSQQSSLSDLSLTGGGSPKLQLKNGQTTRSAKKRDVRTISNSPSDLGPPSKTVGTPRSNRSITLQKRNSPTATPITETKSSPPAKKIVPRRPIIQQQPHIVVKLPLKDHNRLSGPTPIPKGNTTTTVTKTLLRSSPSHLTTTTITASSQPTVVTQQQNHIRNGTPTQLVAIIDGTTQQQKQKQLQIIKAGTVNNHNNNNNHNGCNNNNNNSKISVVELNLAHANKGIEALSVLIQHLVFNLDAFSCPPLKETNEKQTKNLVETRLLLEDTRVTCQNLEEQLIDKETLFAARETEIQELHRRELNKVENCLAELERTTQEHIVSLETELTKKGVAADETLKSYMKQAEIKFLEYENNIKEAKEREIDLLKRISTLSCTENELREKVHSSENEFGERLRLATQRERELTDKFNSINRQLDEMKIKAEQKERELGEKLNISQDEICVLRRNSNRCSIDTQQSPQQLTKSPTSLNRVQILQDEVESLRCVLELKQSEITDLRKQTQEYERAAEELPSALIKISGLESRVEDLQVQLNAKLEQEKDLISKNKHLQESFAHEVNNRNRLSLHNEELRWKLKQNSEKFALALNDLSKSYIDQSTTSINSKTSDIESFGSMTKSNGSDKIVECFEMDDVSLSPPTSPIIKGVVEKSDSVSWVLEMDDETPEALASRMVRRAGSFRSNLSEKYIHSPIPKRQKCQGNALSQSASAASILRQNSDTSPQKHLLPQTNQRIRSKSVSVKDTEPNNKRIVRSNSGTSSSSSSKKIDLLTAWKDPLCTSSPLVKKQCPSVQENGKDLLNDNTNMITTTKNGRLSTFNVSDQFDEFERNNKSFRTKREHNNRGLITCNTSALTSSNRQELCSTSLLPSHPSVQDLKKHQIRPKVSAGEALVSGANSEDETSSTSSDSSSDSLNHSSSSNSARVLMEKYVASLEGGGHSTPMDVSWSEDGDQFTSESVV